MWDIPSLREDRLATVIPTCTYGGGPVDSPTDTLFVWRTAALSKARGCVVAFYVDDWRLEPLWKAPEHYSALFLQHGVAALIEPDYSLWINDALAVQLYNVFRMRTLGRLWQDVGLSVIPNLAWSDERSFPFCFSGIPVGAPVVACEARTPGSCDADRRRFLAGLTQSVKEVQPKNVLLYGGRAHRFWLQDRLPLGPKYHLITSWTTERDKIRAVQQRQLRERNQLNLFGGTQWAAEAQQAAA